MAALDWFVKYYLISNTIVPQYILIWNGASLLAQVVKNLPAVQETQVQPLDPEGPLKKWMAATPVFLPGGFHGQRSLAGYS